MTRGPGFAPMVKRASIDGTPRVDLCDVCNEEELSLTVRKGKGAPVTVCVRCVLGAMEVATGAKWLGQLDWIMTARAVGRMVRDEKAARREAAAEARKGARS